MKAKDIIDAWAEIRKTNNTIPDDVLDLMKNSAISKLEQEKKNEKNEIRIVVCGAPKVGKSSVIYLIRQKLSEFGFDIDHQDMDYKNQCHFNTAMNKIVSNEINGIGLTKKTKITISEETLKQPIK